MNSDIVGQRYVATGAPSTVWVVSDEVRTDMKVPHVRLLKSGEPGTTKLIAENALQDTFASCRQRRLAIERSVVWSDRQISLRPNRC